MESFATFSLLYPKDLIEEDEWKHLHMTMAASETIGN